MPELWGGSADLAESQQHDDQGRRVVPARATARPTQWTGDPSPAGCCTSASASTRMGAIMNGIAAARRHPRLRRHVPDVLRLHARRGPPGGADAAAGHLRVDPRLDRPRRGRPDPPADRAPRRAARDPRPRRRPARPTPTRPPPPGGRCSSTPTGPAGLALTRQNVPVFPRGTDGFADTGDVAPRAATSLTDGSSGGLPDVVLVGTGSEVQLAVAAARAARGGRRRRPAWCRCRAGSGSTRRTRPTARPCSRRPSRPGSRSRPASRMGWREVVGDHGRIVSIEHYGASRRLRADLTRSSASPPRPSPTPPRDSLRSPPTERATAGYRPAWTAAHHHAEEP